MEEFIQEFRAEASGIISSLQESVLLLEQNNQNKDIIEEIFRGIHTLKGSSRMFGFDEVENITHELENTYDQIREGEIKVNKAIIELSLQVVDMSNSIIQGDFDQDEYEELLAKVGSGEIAQDDEIVEGGVYQVLYHPSENVYERGVNPMAAINELKELGIVKLNILSQTGSLEEQEEAKKFNTVFEAIVKLNGPKMDLEDVFLFMDEDEFAIYDLDSDEESWSAALERAQKFAEKKFTKKYRAEYNDVLSACFEGIEEVKESVKNEVSEEVKSIAKKSISSASDSSLNYINVKLDRLDEMMRLVSELVTIKAELGFRASVSSDDNFINTIERLEKVTNRFRDNAFSMRLVPLQVLSMKFQRMVRDFGDKTGKEINLITEGLSTEIDKSIINEIEAPLMHIIRNAIDHGLETTEERKKVGKEEKGLLKIVAFYAGANVFIQVQDDGKGLDLKRIREKAIQKGIIKKNQKLTEQETIDLIFEPGFSTHDTATELSGRGVGMDVVRQKIKDLRGSIEITTEEGLGTAFTLRLPLSLSILDVLHVKVGNVNYILPHDEVEQCLSERLNNDVVQKRGFNVKYKNELIPHLHLNKLFSIPKDESVESSIIIINKNDQLVSMEVDKIVGEEQLVIKPVDDALKSLEYLSGVSVLGNGELAFLLDSRRLKETFAHDEEQSN